MAQQQNTRVIIKAQPEGWVKESDMEVVQAPPPEPGEGQVLVRNIAMSLDPYMRGRMTSRKSYIQGFQLGEVLQAGVVGRIARSNNAKFAEGDHVRSEEHTSELQSLMRISYAVFCLKKKNRTHPNINTNTTH